MKYIMKPVLFVILLSLSVNANSTESKSLTTGEKVFRAYCWGCHHQTSEAFGPSFQEIANKRDVSEIQGHIVSPKSTYKQLGHKRSVMPAFGEKLSQKELELITNFILSYKGNS
ncbi:MAG: c-type cytochrome [Campylobacterota bacterium]|nr:c-type cytochrome [Campylobacterota bacterium]